MKPKKLFGFENKKSPWICGRSQVDISPISSFFASHSLNRRQNSHSVFWREISKFLSSDFIFGFLFEHQFNNLIEFSENNFFVKWFIGNLWKHEDHFWNVSLDKKIIKTCEAYPIYFLNPCENFRHQIKKAILEDQVFLVTNSWTAFEIFFRFSVKNFHLESQILIKKIKMTLTKNLYEIWLLNTYRNFLSQKPESERNKFSHFKIFRWLREVLFSLDLFSLQIRMSEKDRENLHFFFTDRQNWNTLTRFLCQVFFC